MLYSVYAVLRVRFTQCQLMIMAWRDVEGWLNFVFCDSGRVMDEKEREGDENETNVEDTSGYDKSGVQLTWLGSEDPISV